MKTKKFIVFSVTFGALVSTVLLRPNLAGASFNYSRPITINHNLVPNTDQTNFPVLVSGNYAYLATIANGGKAQNANGYDVGFYTNSDCVSGKLNWETELYNSGTGQVAYWINIPNVSHIVDTVFYMCYGDSTISADQSNKAAVWDSNFKGVWHLGENYSIAPGNYKDSTAAPSNGSLTDINGNTFSATAAIGNGLSLNGDADFVDVGNPAKLQITSSFTLSAWVKLNNYNQGFGRIITKFVNGSNRGWELSVDDWTSPSYNNLSLSVSYSASAPVWKYQNTSFPTNQLVYVTGVYNSASQTAQLYRDGVAISQQSYNNNISPNNVGSSINNSTGNVRIGRRPGSSDPDMWRGIIDEVRISNAARSADWIKTEYNNQINPLAFYVVGSELFTDVTAPIISNIATSSVTSSSATVSWTTDEPADSQVEYGTTTTYGSLSTLNSSLVTSHSEILSGLASDTLYHYRVKSKDAAGNLTVSQDKIFATNVIPDAIRPAVPGNLTASSTSPTQIDLSWDVSTDNVAVAGYKIFRDGFQIATTTITSYSNTGLASFTTYTYTVSAFDTSGNVSAQSAPVIIASQPPADFTPPVIFNIVASNIATSSAVILWTTDEPADSQVEYGATASYGSTTILNALLQTSHAVNLNGLNASAVYHYRIKSKDAVGNIATSTDQTFITTAASDITPPVISALVATNSTLSSVQVSWNTDEVATSLIEYGLTSGYGQIATSSSGFVHDINLFGLLAGKIYHYRVRSSDFANNEAVSLDNTFSTVSPPGAGSLSRLQVSPDHRFLTKSDGAPFVWMGDTAWFLPKLSPSDIDIYLNDTGAKGFNAAWVYLYTYGSEPVGENPFLNNDIAAPNELYWQKIDDLVAAADSKGLYTGLVISWPHFLIYKNNTLARIENLGRWLGTRYSNRNNVVWVISGEYSASYGYCVSCIPQSEKDKFERMALGIRAGGGAQLMTIHPGIHSSLPDFGNSPWLDFSTIQSGHQRDNHSLGFNENYEFITFDYNYPFTRPAIDGEPNYEYLPDSWFALQNAARAPINAADVRRKAYWSVFAGAFGHVYGSESLEIFHRQDDPIGLNYNTALRNLIPNWQDALNAPGRSQMIYLKSFLESKPMLGRIPDQSIVTSDLGTDLSHIQATRASNGSYAWIYIPDGRAATINMTKLAGPLVNASWYNPQNGSSISAGQFTNTGSSAFDAPGATATGNDWVLVLESYSDTTAPVISSISSSNITSSSATITWTTNESATASVEYGLTTSYGSTSLTTSGTSHTIAISNLSPSTLYNYRVKATDSAGNLAVSADFTFTTQAPPDLTPPVISNLLVSDLTSSSTTISFTTDEPADSQVEYGTTAAYGSLSTLNSSLVTSHSEILSDLASDTLYHYRVKFKDAAGNLAVSADFTFTTQAPPDLTPPVISNLLVSDLTSSSATISFTTDEPADSQVEYGTTAAYENSAFFDATLLTNHVHNFLNLLPNTLYHFRVLSKGFAGNVATSTDSTFTTAANISKISNLQAAVLLSWVNPNDDQIQNIVILRSGVDFVRNFAPEALLATLDPSQSTYLDNSIAPALTYYYSIFNRGYSGAYSEPLLIRFSQ